MYYIIIARQIVGTTTNSVVHDSLFWFDTFGATIVAAHGQSASATASPIISICATNQGRIPSQQNIHCR